MERRSGLGCLVMMMMMMLLFMVSGGEQEYQKSSFDNFADCYGACFSVCLITSNSVYCAGKCVNACSAKATNPDISRSSESSSSIANRVTPKEHYCQLGCALKRCTNTTTTPLHPNVDKLAKCFESCSVNTCKPKVSWNALKGGNGEPTTADEQTYDGFCKLGCANAICKETVDKDTVCGSCVKTCSSNGDI